VIPDNGNIPTPPDGLTALADSPRIHPVGLPTYAPWLNPLEHLWRWVRQDILKLPRWGEEWPQGKHRGPDFLAQVAPGSSALLRYVGLTGKGKLATVLNSS
jgi:transposase